MNIYEIRAFLNARSVAFVDSDFQLQNNSDGKGTFIARWDEAKLGLKPTAAELKAIQAEAAMLQIEASKDPHAEIFAALLTLKGKVANPDVVALINVLLGQAGRAGRVAGRPV